MATGNELVARPGYGPCCTVRPTRCVFVCKGRSNRGAPATTGVLSVVADETAAAAARNGRRRHSAAATHHHRAGDRQRHVRHQAQPTAEGHLLRTEVIPTEPPHIRYNQRCRNHHRHSSISIAPITVKAIGALHSTSVKTRLSNIERRTKKAFRETQTLRARWL